MQVALFDIDGTLYPGHSELTYRLDRLITEFVAEHLSLSVDEADRVRRETLRAHGTTLRGLMDLHQTDPVEFYEFITTADPREYLVPDPALKAMLERSTARIAAFTNAPRAHAEHVFEALNIQGIFDPVFTIEDSGYLGKPHPDAYDGVLGRLEAPPARITMIEDTRRFLAPAKARGMRTVLINGTGHDPADPDGIDAIVESIHDLPKAAPWLFAEE